MLEMSVVHHVPLEVVARLLAVRERMLECYSITTQLINLLMLGVIEAICLVGAVTIINLGTIPCMH